MIGLYAALTVANGRFHGNPRTRLFVMTGICGCYTTFSAFSGEVLTLWLAGNLRQALLYLVLSVASWLVAVWLGDLLAHGINKMGRA